MEECGAAADPERLTAGVPMIPAESLRILTFPHAGRLQRARRTIQLALTARWGIAAALALPN